MNEVENPTTLNLEEWYSPLQATARLSANSGRPVDVNYVRSLARYGKVRAFQVSERARLYFKADVDAYVVEDRGKKVARVNRQKALEAKGKKGKQKARA